MIPPLLAERLADQPGAVIAPACWAFEGAVLFVDISGFATATERFDATGPDGVEHLAQHLDGYFDRLVQGIEAHGGAVAAFVGDAALAVWRADPEPLAACAARAARCAVELGALTSEITHPDFPTALKTALGAGNILHGLLGDPTTRCATILGGTAANDARVAMNRCAPGEVMLAGSARRLLSAATSGVSEAGNHSVLDALPVLTPRPYAHVTPIDGAMLRPFIARPVLERVAPGRLAEFRQVSVCYVHVPEARFAAADDLPRVNGIFGLVRDEVHRYGGAIHDIGDDHNGLVVVSVFGQPGFAFEDHAVRAVRAAQAILSALERRALHGALAVASGRVLCASIGSASVSAYFMLGDVMNRGARLMQAAHAELLCDATTSERAGNRTAFEFVRTSSLKGITEQVHIYRPLGRQIVLSTPTLIGRTTECARLRQHVADLRADRRGGVLLLEGEAGIGKSTLLRELRVFAESAGVRFMLGGADAVDAATPYAAWQPVFEALTEISPRMPRAQRTEAVAHLLDALPASEHDVLPLLSPVFDLELGDSDYTRAMSAQARTEELARLLVTLLHQQSARRGIVIALEDCQWMDSASLALVAAVQRGAPAVLLALVTRPLSEPLPAEWGTVRAQALARIVLEALDVPAIELLACARLGARRLDPAITSLLAEGSRGNPFFVAELCHALLDGGHVVREDDYCRLLRDVKMHRLSPNGTVQGVVGARIDRLPSAARLIMQIASVSGLRFSLEMLNQVHTLEGAHADLPAAIARLVEHGFVLRPGDGSNYEFKHAIVQEVAYQQLSFAQRKQLHRRIAEWMEARATSDVALLAHHWSAADDAERALHFLEQAGREAVQRFANREVEDHISRALGIAVQHAIEVVPATRCRWLQWLGLSRLHLGKPGQSTRDLAESIQALGSALPAPWRMRVFSLPLELVRQLVNHGLRRAPPAIAQAAHERLALLADAHFQLGRTAYFCEDMLLSAYAIFRAANLNDQIGDPERSIYSMCGVMLLLSLLSPRLGHSYLRRIDALVPTLRTPMAQAEAGLMATVFLVGQGLHAEALRHAERAVGTYRQYGDGRRLEETLIHVAYAYLHQGNYAQARAPIEEMQRSSTRRGDSSTIGWSRLMRAQVVLATESPQAALDVLGEDFEAGTDSRTVIALHATAAAGHWRAGNDARAREHAEIALARLIQHGATAVTMMVYTSYIAEVALGVYARNGDQGSAGFAARATRMTRDFARLFPVGRSRAAAWSGLFDRLRGRERTARRGLRAALATALKVDLVPDIARAHALLGATDSADHIAQATALCRRCGASTELDSLMNLPRRAAGT